MSGNTDFDYDVFLSHNQAAQPRVRRLLEPLRAAGLRLRSNEPVAICDLESA